MSEPAGASDSKGSATPQVAAARNGQDAPGGVGEPASYDALPKDVAAEIRFPLASLRHPHPPTATTSGGSPIPAGLAP